MIIYYNIFIAYSSTAFYGLSLIAQTPDGAMSLKDFGWETYRVRAHSIPSSIAKTDTYQCAERRISRLSTSSKNISQQVSVTANENTSKKEINQLSPTGDVSGQFQSNQYDDSIIPEFKSTRSFTMPSSISLIPNEKSNPRRGK